MQIYKSIFILLMVGPSFIVNASQLWTATSSERSETSTELTSQNYSANRAALENAMLKGRDSGSTTVTVPLPDGKLAEFNLQYDSILSPQLEAENPQLITYKGTQANQPENSGRFDYTMQGFHAMFHYNGKMVYVDPVRNQPGSYLSYYAKPSEGFIDQVTGVPSDNAINPKQAISARAATQKRTLRLAISTTGEYANYFEGTFDATKAAITTAINRVNQIYSTDLAIEFELVYFNIYTDAATDPFENSNGGADMLHNHISLVDKIGVGAFDIGHLFSTGGGGVARISSVCQNNVKGHGVTGKKAPVGDSFYIDYVAHEIGHQLGATHTFNGTIAACSGGNRSSKTAVEPGSGSTIMAYAGICGKDNLQRNSNAYFHTASIAQIRKLIDSRPTCGTTMELVNQDPVADAGSNYVIPEGTPFVLSGSATDADNDNLSYIWEQMDTGPANSELDLDLGDGPLFRSWSPSPSPDRYLPRLQDLINGTLSKGETYAKTDRTLTFRLTARDGKGGVDSDEMTLTVSGSTKPFRVTQPVTGSMLYKKALVKWLPEGTKQSPINCNKVDILLSDDNGVSFTQILESGTDNDGQHLATLPDISVSDAFMMVKCSNNVFFALSDRFAIDPSGEEDSIDENNENSTSGASGGGITLIWLLVMSVAAVTRRRFG
ncbi:reprolysin-like metallopeptidase [Vibrio sp. SCSIO 43137]|uniref:reprolysin-like metallopeptidase n=1 Tax=Vibrio sp. SCSIO 43137 TaxID=3021011 RepID=UPI0023082521|nr:M12 family metallo-peptidase [Vibrio sp. SCSIO 43137]WCE31752.1 M12 family metallo-peptidase [Vibrio sp. SCSIO 43137]